jgi:hypothetical protein
MILLQLCASTGMCTLVRACVGCSPACETHQSAGGFDGARMDVCVACACACVYVVQEHVHVCVCLSVCTWLFCVDS